MYVGKEVAIHSCHFSVEAEVGDNLPSSLLQINKPEHWLNSYFCAKRSCPAAHLLRWEKVQVHLGVIDWLINNYCQNNKITGLTR